MPVVVQFVPDPLQLLYELLVDVPYALSLVVAVLRGFVRDGIFLRFDNLGDQESELLCPPNSVELWDLFLWWYFVPHPKFLHVALEELEGAIVDSLHTVRCRSLVTFWVLG